MASKGESPNRSGSLCQVPGERARGTAKHLTIRYDAAIMMRMIGTSHRRSVAPAAWMTRGVQMVDKSPGLPSCESSPAPGDRKPIL